MPSFPRRAMWIAWKMLPPLLVIGALGGCSSSSSGSGPPACSVNQDCPEGDGCYFLVQDHCAAKGQCLATPGVSPTCKSAAVCGCEGNIIRDACKAPRDYSTAPTTGVHPEVDDAGALVCE